MDIYIWGLGQLKCWAATVAPTAGKEPNYYFMDLCWWPGENNAWETPGPIASTPMVKVETRAVSKKEQLVSTHSGWKVMQQSMLTGQQFQRRNTQWLFFQWQCFSPIYLTPQIRNTGKKQIWWGLYSNHWRADLVPDRGVKVTEQNGDLTQFSRQGEVTTTSVKPHNKEIMADIHWGKRWQTFMLKIALEPSPKFNLHRL